MEYREINSGLARIQAKAQEFDDLLFMQRKQQDPKRSADRRSSADEANKQEKSSGKSRRDLSEVTCYNCQKKGHIARDCQASKRNERNKTKKNTAYDGKKIQEIDKDETESTGSDGNQEIGLIIKEIGTIKTQATGANGLDAPVTVCKHDKTARIDTLTRQPGKFL